ncbi:DUF411 domain-containing protein [Agrobacterium tumefaciens]|uniref:DUF411 domain-containing protein n=1 Tax=Agrobacterium tumefaciens TaxID=358 RepID=UPI001573F065|nr:DUF411 domain-containing protein [Agrobacterium tumefaciens]NSZ03203.1 DUF411 domain-containing protein [Agrobacterium tumefaciens]NSZ36654.1 DUF411 domain-containing protein [Agrobacterium tumefaciens]NTA84760.1 DUF411 domain-containing protein [Agrobacterium tumefaciens]NTB24738.1 DUF411 domain-containing protein [Agrobacterium tumefaciens]NTB27516.1 DUF411 domain-containing protein [Agrobacterium tumefaciens]
MKRRQFMATTAAALLLPRMAAARSVPMTVHKDPYCGCCEAWASAFESAGYAVALRDEEDMDAVKARMKIPNEVRGCHTAVVDGYYLEGHVPLEAAEKLLRKRPPLAGLAVAGMPKGSLGMGTDPKAFYDVMAVPRDGSKPFVFMAVRPA